MSQLALLVSGDEQSNSKSSISEDVYNDEDSRAQEEPGSLPSSEILTRSGGHSDQRIREDDETLTLVPVDNDGAPKKPTLRYLSAPLSDGRVS